MSDVYQYFSRFLHRGRSVDADSQRYKSLFEQNPDAVFSLDPDGRFVSANPASLRLVRMPAYQLLHAEFDHLVVPEDRQRAREDFALALSGDARNCDIAIHNADGQRLELSVALVPMIVEGQIAGVFGVARDMTERKQSEQQLAYMAQYDTLTGLPNRALFNAELARAIAHARRHGTLVGVLFIDLDKFKEINDRHGHAAGDWALKLVAQRLKNCLREEDIVARLGGDEFTVVIENIGDIQYAEAAARKILQACTEPIEIDGSQQAVSTSIGIAAYPTDGASLDEVLRCADLAMYCAKKGRNNYQLYGADVRGLAEATARTRSALQEAVEQESFVLHYHPQVDLRQGGLIGAEALLRWQHPELGVVMPADFLAIAEESGQMVAIGEWVLREACRQNKAWQDRGLPPIRITVNISARQLQHPGFVDTVRRALKDTGLAPQCLELEASEQMLMADIQLSMEILTQIKALGVRVGIDDIGTGISSLSCLTRLPLDTFKIDQSLVQGIRENRYDAALAKAIVSLARCLRLMVIAEGVEQEAQVDYLRQIGCDAMQGHFVSAPVAAVQVEQMLGQLAAQAAASR